MRDLNLERFRAAELDGMSKVADALGAMPFLADRRVVIVTDTQALKVAARRELWSVAQNVPEGNTLVLADLLPTRSQRPEPFGAMAGRTALRIDTTVNEAVRARFVQELLGQLDATAEPRVIAELSNSEAELSAIRNDLEKLALLKKKITYKDLEQDSLSVEDPKAYKFASALAEGRMAEALEIASDLFANDSRGAGVPLVSALATEFGLIWELARPGGQLPARAKWRERVLRPIAAQIGERAARAAYERAVRGFEAIVTGKIDEPRLLIEMLTAELGATLSRLKGRGGI
jgi:DNA polymerase III delta subunit